MYAHATRLSSLVPAPVLAYPPRLSHPDAVDTASENHAVPVDDKGREGNAPVVDMLHGEGDSLLHELGEACGGQVASP